MAYSQERKALIAPSQRMLLCMLFRECRLLTRSMKPYAPSYPICPSTELKNRILRAPWLQRTIGWFAEFYVEEDLAGDLDQEVYEAMERIHGLYDAAQSGARQTQQKVCAVLSLLACR